MSLTHWDPFREMEELMRRFPARRQGLALNNGFVPAVDMYEEGNNLIVKTPLAGVDPEKVEVSVENQVLTIKGEDKTEHEVDEKNYYRKEIRSGSFFRQVPLPMAVKEDDLEAEFADGILKITAPKQEKPQPKKVNVKVVKKKS